jgi:hypothetical protein
VEGQNVADRTVYFAKISRDPTLWNHSFVEDMNYALLSDDRAEGVTRYGKTWHVSQPEQLDDGFLAAKLGFVRTTSRNATTWDAERRDFVITEGMATEGSFAVFVIDLEREIIAFEIRPPDITLTGFLGAFRKLLATAGVRARVELLPDPREWRQFVSSVERVVRVTAVIHDPNPRWRPGAENLRAIVEGADAERGTVTATARENGALNTDAEWIDAAVTHVAEHGKGDVRATGVTNGETTKWSLSARLQISLIHDVERLDVSDIARAIVERLRSLYGR